MDFGIGSDNVGVYYDAFDADHYAGRIQTVNPVFTVPFISGVHIYLLTFCSHCVRFAAHGLPSPPADLSLRIGISGPPGVGKSSLIETWGCYLADHGHRVAVLAIDPSSVETGGAILGDKTRMARLSSHPAAYVRPSPARGTLGESLGGRGVGEGGWVGVRGRASQAVGKVEVGRRLIEG